MSGFEKFGDESERLRECLEEGFELDCRERNSAGNPWAFVRRVLSLFRPVLTRTTGRNLIL